MSFPQFVMVASAIVVATMAGAVFVRRRLPAAVIAIAGAMAVTSVDAAAYLRHYADDAYITLRYARYFAAGQGPVWNPGEHVEGYTDFLWMALIAGLHKLGADLVDASLWLSYASMLAMFVIAWRIWALWADEEGGELAQPAVLAVTLLLIGLNDSLAFWGFSGLETGMAAALLTLTAYLFMLESRGARAPWSALAAAAAAMTRPEMMLVAAVTGGFTLREAAERRDGHSLRRLALWCAMFGAAYGTYFAWRYSYYGHLFPNTYYAKMGTSSDFANRGMGYVHAYGMPYLFVPFVMGTAALVFIGANGMRRDAQYVLAVIAAWTSAVIMEGGDAFAHGRVVAPVVPLTYVAGVAGLTIVLSRAIPQRRQLTAVGLLTAALAALALVRGSADPTVPADRHARDEREALGRLLHAGVPAEYTVAVYASGAVPYYAQTRAGPAGADRRDDRALDGAGLRQGDRGAREVQHPVHADRGAAGVDHAGRHDAVRDAEGDDPGTARRAAGVQRADRRPADVRAVRGGGVPLRRPLVQLPATQGRGGEDPDGLDRERRLHGALTPAPFTAAPRCGNRNLSHLSFFAASVR
jgi:hypothetical protein